MRTAILSRIAFSTLAVASACLLSSCETTSTHTASRKLPAYEAPIARSDFQTVRTTAYTHSESDHLEYGARNALGGRLQSASIPRGRVEAPARAVPVSQVDNSDMITIAYSSRAKKSSASTKKSAKKDKATRSKKSSEPQIGSAAADWSRWPIGTTFRIISTGQIYRIDDYGWALAGRNTIDLYMGNRSDMNSWGVRNEPIQILRWGDKGQSMRVLQPRLAHKHCRRMVLELQGQHEEAAALN